MNLKSCFASLIGLVFALFTLLTGIVIAGDQSTDLMIHDAWVRPTAFQSEHNGDHMHDHGHNDAEVRYGPTAAYLTIENVGADDWYLVGAASPVIPVIEIHETVMDGDVMRMSPQESVPVPAGERVEFRPGGLHLMLIDLSADLFPGDAITLELTFAPADDADPTSDDLFTLTIGAPVVDEPLDNPAEISVQGIWARATAVSSDHDGHHDHAQPTHRPPTAAYMTITNFADEPDALVAAEASGVGVVEIHTTEMDGEVMRMVQLDALDLPPGETVTLAPRGLHLMLIDLESDLVPGDALTLHLEFASGARMTLGVPVLDDLAVDDHASHGDH